MAPFRDMLHEVARTCHRPPCLSRQVEPIASDQCRDDDHIARKQELTIASHCAKVIDVRQRRNEAVPREVRQRRTGGSST